MVARRPRFHARYLFPAVLAFVCVAAWLALRISSASSGTPTFSPATNYVVGINPHAVAISDFSGDGKLDLAIANSGSGTVSILIGDGSGVFGPATNFAAGITPVSIATADFNGDNKTDLAVANNGGPGNPGTISILSGDGTGGFGTTATVTAGMHPSAVVTGHFNGDGKVDLAVANYDSNDVSVLINAGTGSFTSPTNIAVGTNPRALTGGDFNNDGKLDLVSSNQGSNSVSLLLGNGAGSFGPAVNFGVGSAPAAVAGSDLNSDGKTDLITSNSGSNDVSVLLGDGMGGFSSATNFPVESSPFGVVASDFYPDGKPDIAAANSAAGNLSVLLGNGSGGLSGPTNSAVGTGPRNLASADLNNDGKPDLVAPNFGSENVSVLLNTSVVTAQLSGTIKDVQNNAIQNVTVEAINPSNQQVVTSSVSNGSGHYSLTVPLGTYNLKATPPQGSEFQPVTIENLSIVGDLVQDITLARPNTVELHGQITDRNNQPFTNVLICLQRTVGGIFSNTCMTQPPNGNYSLRVEPGDYNLVLSTGVASALSFQGDAPISLTQDMLRDIQIQNRILSGFVKDNNGQPVANVQVDAEIGGPNFGTPRVSFSGLTWYLSNNSKSDANGFYSMMVFPGIAGLTVTPPAGSIFGPLRIQDVNTTNDVTRDITLAPTAVELHGQITDRNNQPFTNVMICLQRTVGGTFSNTCVTQPPNGNYSLHVEAGDYTLLLSTGVASALSFQGDAPISLTQDTLRDIQIQNRTLSGFVKDSSGQPVANVQVDAEIGGPNFGTPRVSFSGLTWYLSNNSKSDANGFYSMMVFPGIAGLTVTPPVGSVFGPLRIPNVDTTNDATRDITLVPAAVELHGQITDRNNQPFTNVLICLQRTVGGIFSNTCMTQPSNGNYSLRVEPGDYNLVLSTGVASALSFQGDAPISLTQDTLRDIQIQNRTLSGFVKDSSGQPAANVQVDAEIGGPNFGTPRATFSGLTWFIANNSKSDANGFYSMMVFPGIAGLTVTPPVGSVFGPSRIPDVNTTNDATRDITLQLPTRRITGRITDTNGHSLTGVTVILSGSQSAISTTDGNGNYVFVNVTEGGNYAITPSRTSYQFSPASAVFNNLNGDQTANFTGTLFTFSVTGRVTDASNAGVADVTLTLSGATTAVTRTDNAGTYAFNGVAAFANYSVKAAKPNFTIAPSRTDITNLSSNQTVNFTATLQPNSTPPLDEDFNAGTRNPDKFQFGSLSTDPTAFDPLVSVAQQNGHLEIKPRADAFGTHYNGYTSVNAVNLTANTPSVEVVQPATGGAQTIFSIGSGNNDNFGMMIQTSAPVSITERSNRPRGPLDPSIAQLVFQIRIDGQLTVQSIPYDPAVHHFWRFRFDITTNAILFETSPDSTAWTTQHSVVLNKAVTPMAVELSSGTSSATTTPGTAIFDNFHLGSKFSISGNVTTANSSAVSNVLMLLAGALTRTLTTDGVGGYSFTDLEAGGNYTVTPSLNGYTFTPNQQTFNSLGADKVADFTANAVATPTPTPTPSPTPSGPTIFVEQGTNLLAAVNSVTFVRGPFTLTDNYTFNSDHRTRVIFFTTTLGFLQPSQPDLATLSVEVNGLSVPVENVGPSSFAPIDVSYIVFRLPDLPPGEWPLRIRFQGILSNNSPVLAIAAPPTGPG